MIELEVALQIAQDKCSAEFCMFEQGREVIGVAHARGTQECVSRKQVYQAVTCRIRVPNVSKDARHVPLVLGHEAVDCPTYHDYVAGSASGQEWYRPTQIRQRHPPKAIVALAHFDAPRDAINPAEVHRPAEKPESPFRHLREVRAVDAILQVKNLFCRVTQRIAEFRIRKLASCSFDPSMEQRRKLPGYRPPPARPCATIQLLCTQVAHRSERAAGVHRNTTDPVRSDSTTAIVARLVSTISDSGTGAPVFSTTAATKASSSP